MAEKKLHFQEKKLIGEDDVILLLKLNLVNKNIVNESLIDFHLIMMTQKITQMTSHYRPIVCHND